MMMFGKPTAETEIRRNSFIWYSFFRERL